MLCVTHGERLLLGFVRKHETRLSTRWTAPTFAWASIPPPRVGRTARGRDGKGRALLMLMPEELGFLKYLKAAKVRRPDHPAPSSTPQPPQTRWRIALSHSVAPSMALGARGESLPWSRLALSTLLSQAP